MADKSKTKKSEVEPVLTVNSRDAHFPRSIALAAQHSERETGCPASVTLAQWALESGYGKSMPRTSNNPFGIKWTPSSPYEYVEAPTSEWDQRSKRFIKIVARFVKYPDVETAFMQHGHLLMSRTGPYGAAVQTYERTNSIFSFVRSMGRVYATDPNYAEKILQIIETFRLEEFRLPQASEPQLEPPSSAGDSPSIDIVESAAEPLA